MPVDPEPAPNGNVRLEYTEDLEGRGDWFASVVGAGLIAEGFAHTPHFATCPFASQHRKRG